MGHGSFTPSDWDRFSTKHETRIKSAEETFSTTAVKAFLSTEFNVRECCETAEKPQVTPIIIALDVTGSMGEIPHKLIQGGLATLMEELLKRRSVPNPQIMFVAVGDVRSDRYPLQVTQFESDIQIAEQLKKLYLEGGGGPHGSESYPIVWDFATNKTRLDCFEKRGEKGLLFTIGDEFTPESISGKHREKFVGIVQATESSTQTLLNNVVQMYDVHHICVTRKMESAPNRDFSERVEKHWQSLLGKQNVFSIEMCDYGKIPELLVSVVDIQRGKKDKEYVLDTWGRDTKAVVARAVQNISTAIAPRHGTASGGVFRPGAGIILRREFSTLARHPLPHNTPRKLPIDSSISMPSAPNPFRLFGATSVSGPNMATIARAAIRLMKR